MMMNCFLFAVFWPIHHHIMYDYCPPLASGLCCPSMHHLSPSNSGDMERQAPSATVSQRRDLRIRAIHSGPETGKKMQKNEAQREKAGM